MVSLIPKSKSLGLRATAGSSINSSSKSKSSFKSNQSKSSRKSKRSKGSLSSQASHTAVSGELTEYEIEPREISREILIPRKIGTEDFCEYEITASRRRSSSRSKSTGRDFQPYRPTPLIESREEEEIYRRDSYSYGDRDSYYSDPYTDSHATERQEWFPCLGGLMEYCWYGGNSFDEDDWNGHQSCLSAILHCGAKGGKDEEPSTSESKVREERFLDGDKSFEERRAKMLSPVEKKPSFRMKLSQKLAKKRSELSREDSGMGVIYEDDVKRSQPERGRPCDNRFETEKKRRSRSSSQTSREIRHPDDRLVPAVPKEPEKASTSTWRSKLRRGTQPQEDRLDNEKQDKRRASSAGRRNEHSTKDLSRDNRQEIQKPKGILKRNERDKSMERTKREVESEKRSKIRGSTKRSQSVRRESRSRDDQLDAKKRKHVESSSRREQRKSESRLKDRADTNRRKKVDESRRMSRRKSTNHSLVDTESREKVAESSRTRHRNDRHDVDGVVDRKKVVRSSKRRQSSKELRRREEQVAIEKRTTDDVSSNRRSSKKEPRHDGEKLAIEKHMKDSTSRKRSYSKKERPRPEERRSSRKYRNVRNLSIDDPEEPSMESEVGTRREKAAAKVKKSRAKSLRAPVQVKPISLDEKSMSSDESEVLVESSSEEFERLSYYDSDDYSTDSNSQDIEVVLHDQISESWTEDSASVSEESEGREESVETIPSQSDASSEDMSYQNDDREIPESVGTKNRSGATQKSKSTRKSSKTVKADDSAIDDTIPTSKRRVSSQRIKRRKSSSQSSVVDETISTKSCNTSQSSATTDADQKQDAAIDETISTKKSSALRRVKPKKSSKAKEKDEKEASFRNETVLTKSSSTSRWTKPKSKSSKSVKAEEKEACIVDETIPNENSTTAQTKEVASPIGDNGLATAQSIHTPESTEEANDEDRASTQGDEIISTKSSTMSQSEENEVTAGDRHLTVVQSRSTIDIINGEVEEQHSFVEDSATSQTRSTDANCLQEVQQEEPSSSIGDNDGHLSVIDEAISIESTMSQNESDSVSPSRNNDEVDDIPKIKMAASMPVNPVELSRTESVKKSISFGNKVRKTFSFNRGKPTRSLPKTESSEQKPRDNEESESCSI